MRIGIFLVLGTVCLGSTAAHAITRSCSMHYELEFTEGYGWLTGQKIGTGSFIAKGGCGRTVPNRCRRRARNLGLKCMAAHWKSPKKLPAECRSKKIAKISKALSTVGPKEIATIEAVDFGVFVHSAKLKKSRLSTSDLSKFVRDKKLKANVWAVSAGNTGCSKRVMLAENFPVSMNALKKAKYSVTLKKAPTIKYKKAKHQGLRLTQTRTVKVGRKKLVPTTQTGVFLEASGTRFLSAESKDRKYHGCGRKAAQNFLRAVGVEVSQVYVGNRMSLNSVLGKKVWNGNKAVVPRELEKGIRRVLVAQGLPKKPFNLIRFRRVTYPQNHIEKQIIKGKSPVIALVNDGNHWVVATGAWSPVFDRKTAFRRFMTHDNGRNSWWSWNKYNLKFGAAQTAVIPTAGGVYKPGTMVFIK